MVKDRQILDGALVTHAIVAAASGERDVAAQLVSELNIEQLVREVGSVLQAQLVEEHGLVDAFLAEAVRAQRSTRWVQAVKAVLRREYVRAAEIYAEIGSGPDEAHARLLAADQLLSEGRRREADAQLAEALAFWRSVGATRYIREAEALLAASA